MGSRAGSRRNPASRSIGSATARDQADPGSDQRCGRRGRPGSGRRPPRPSARPATDRPPRRRRADRRHSATRAAGQPASSTPRRSASRTRLSTSAASPSSARRAPSASGPSRSRSMPSTDRGGGPPAAPDRVRVAAPSGEPGADARSPRSSIRARTSTAGVPLQPADAGGRRPAGEHQLAARIGHDATDALEPARTRSAAGSADSRPSIRLAAGGVDRCGSAARYRRRGRRPTASRGPRRGASASAGRSP